jgi:hypothetical protein
MLVSCCVSAARLTVKIVQVETGTCIQEHMHITLHAGTNRPTKEELSGVVGFPLEDLR